MKGGFSMKRLYTIIIVLLCLSLTSCSNNTEKSIINSVTKVEQLDHQFSNFQITYDEYMKEIKQFFINNYDESYHYNRRYVPEPIDLKNLTKSQLDEAREHIKEQYNILVQISKPYKMDNEKYNVFTKSNITSNDSDIGGFIITRKYMLITENNEWKIMGIENSLSEENTPEDELKYTTVNNQKVEYIDSFEFK